MIRYILVEWPESQLFMEHERFDECYALVDDEDSYMVPEDLYNEIYNSKK